MENQEHEINIAEYALLLLKRWWIILLAAIFCGGLMFVHTKFMVTPMYRSTAKLYVLPSSKEGGTTNVELQMALNLTEDCQEMITYRSVLEAVISRLDLDMTYSQLLSLVSCTINENSRIITLSVSHSDPRTAQEIANAICDEAKPVVQNNVNEDVLNIAEKAYLPSSPYSPSMMKNVALGVLVGVVLSCGLFFIMFVLDDKIKTPDDVESALGLSTLGIIPTIKELK